MSPFDVINRQDLESFLGDFGDDGYETILQILSQMNNILDLMGDALYVILWRINLYFFMHHHTNII